MRDYDLALALGTALATAFAAADPSLGAVHIYAHGVEVLGNGTLIERPTEIQLPSVALESKSSPLASSAVIAKSHCDIAITSQIDDDTEAQHSARIRLVKDTMADMTALTTAFTGRGELSLLGKPCPTDVDPSIEQRADKTVIAYRLGYREA